MDIRGQTALVTGRASGIGRTITERLAREGAALVVADIDPVARAGGAVLEIDVTYPIQATRQ